MIRRSSFVFIAVSALIMSACGHQVTPSASGTTPGSGLPAGFMQAKFQVAQPFDFTNHSYVIVFNTTGDGQTPRANASSNGYVGYSMALVVSGSSPTVSLWIYQRPIPNAAPVIQQVPFLQQDLQLRLNSNGINTEFTLLFNRALAFSLTTPTPSPSSTPTTSPSPSASPSATPSPAVATNWNFNYFVTAGQFSASNSTPTDSLGRSPSGANDVTYTSVTLNTAAAFDTGAFQPTLGTAPADASGTISAGDIQNNP